MILCDMKLTFLGTGTSQGVPLIAAHYQNLDLGNPKNWRTRSSIHVEAGGKHIQVDAGPEFRLQCLKNKIEWIDFFILTHGHSDHIAGMDDLRRFCDIIDTHVLDVYSNEYGLQRIAAIFPYAMGEKPQSIGYPCFKPHLMPREILVNDSLTIKSVSLPHGNVQTLGLIFEENRKKLVYYTDCHAVEGEAFELAKNADILVLDFLRPRPHPTHLSTMAALDLVRRLTPAQAYFTHTTGEIDYGVWEKSLPKNCQIAYDGLVAEL